MTKSAAEQLAAALAGVVSVVAGIHYKSLDEPGIEAVCRLGQVAVDRVLALCQQERWGEVG